MPGSPATGDDSYYQYVTSHVHLTTAVEHLLSGPSTSNAYFVAAFGLGDRNVQAAVSTASFQQDFPHGQVYDYPGPHGVTLYADYAAFQDFLDHLGTSDSGSGSGSTGAAPPAPVVVAPPAPVVVAPSAPVGSLSGVLPRPEPL